MAKKQSSKVASSGVDLKALQTKVLQSVESVIKYGDTHNFKVGFKKGVFLVKDMLCSERPKLFTPFKGGSPEDYTLYVEKYIRKVRKLD